MSLDELAHKYLTDKCVDFGHDYIPTYEKYFTPIQQKVLNVLEIGIGGGMHERAMQVHFGERFQKGNCLRMWRDFFPNATIHAVDIDPTSMIEGEDRLITFVADQSSQQDLDNVMKRIGKPLDVVVDDGSHNLHHQTMSFCYLYPYLNSKAIYVIEDIHIAHINGFANLDHFPEPIREVIKNQFKTTVVDCRRLNSTAYEFIFILEKIN